MIFDYFHTPLRVCESISIIFVCETIAVQVETNILCIIARQTVNHVPCQLIGPLPATKLLNTTKGSLEQFHFNRYHQSPQVTELDAIIATSPMLIHVLRLYDYL